MKKIKIIESEYVSFSELCHLANKNNKSSSEVCLEYNIEESQWYLNYHYKKKKIKKETVEKYYYSSKNNLLKNTTKITNIFKKVS